MRDFNKSEFDEKRKFVINLVKEKIRENNRIIKFFLQRVDR